MNHREYMTNYYEEWNKNYFENNGALNGAIFSVCCIDIKAEGGKKCFVRSISNPIHVCLGRNK